MKEEKENNVFYYSDELNDDFASSDITPDKIDENYKYIHKNIFWNFFSIVLYRIFPTFFYIHAKIKYGVKVENKKVIKDYYKKLKNSNAISKKDMKRKKGYFLYLNHTQEIMDTFFPTLITFPRRAYLIANAKNVSMSGMRTLNQMLGAIPIPNSGLRAMAKFEKAVEHYSNKGNVIAIYPEAHVWPYYTKIRNFKSVSFEYPYKLDKAVFTATITYQKKCKKNDSKNKKPKFKIVIYIDGPFFTDKTLNKKDAKEKLRNEVYNVMNGRSKNNNIEIRKYEKITDKGKSQED